MTKSEYKKLKNIIKEALKEFEAEALRDGADLMSEGYDTAALELKKKIVSNLGYDWDEFRKIDHSVRGLSKTSINFSLNDLKKNQDKIKYEISQSLEELNEKVEQVSNKNPNWFELQDKPEIPTKEQINYIIAKATKDLVRKKDVKPPVEKIITKEIIKEVDPYILEDVKSDIYNLQGTIGDIIGKIPEPINIKILKKEISDDNANYVSGVLKDMPNWRALGMGLQGQIDEVKADLKKESIWDRTGTTISPQTAGNDLDMGTGSITATSVIETTPTLLKLNQTTPQVITANSETVVGDDGLLFSDTSDNGKLKSTTAQAVAGLVDLSNYQTKTETLTAGENLVAGNVCYLKSDGKYWKAKGDAEATTKGRIVMATASISANATGVFLINGKYTTSGLTAGGTYFISTATAGAMMTTLPASGKFGRVVGVAESKTVLNFDPSKDYGLVS